MKFKSFIEPEKHVPVSYYMFMFTLPLGRGGYILGVDGVQSFTPNAGGCEIHEIQTIKICSGFFLTSCVYTNLWGRSWGILFWGQWGRILPPGGGRGNPIHSSDKSMLRFSFNFYADNSFWIQYWGDPFRWDRTLPPGGG